MGSGFEWGIQSVECWGMGTLGFREDRVSLRV